METRQFIQKPEIERFYNITESIVTTIEGRGQRVAGKVIDIGCGLALCADGIANYLSERNPGQETYYEGYDPYAGSGFENVRVRWGLKPEFPEGVKVFTDDNSNVLNETFRESILTSIDEVGFFLLRQPDIRGYETTFDIFRVSYELAESANKPLAFITSNPVSLLMVHRLLRLTAINHAKGNESFYGIDYRTPNEELIFDLEIETNQADIYLEETKSGPYWDSKSSTPFNGIEKGLKYDIYLYDKQRKVRKVIKIETFTTYEDSLRILEGQMQSGRMLAPVHKDSYVIVMTFHNTTEEAA